jgi:hypothetical protein
MVEGDRSFVPAELVGDHYRPIGGSYATVEGAMEALEQHCRNKHGGGAFQVYRPDPDRGASVIVEATSAAGDPMRVLALYKVLEYRSKG